MREKEHEDFVAAKDEMDKAIAALKSAIEVLAEGNFKNCIYMFMLFD